MKWLTLGPRIHEHAKGCVLATSRDLTHSHFESNRIAMEGFSHKARQLR